MEDWFTKPGYKNLLVYKLAVIIFDLNYEFCNLYVEKYSRTLDQMIQADRSGKQNIVEGSLEKSLKSYIKLLGVSRASYGELLEDYTDFLRLRKLLVWDKSDPRVMQIRRIRIGNSPNLPNLANFKQNPEVFANTMITLINMECYLLDKMLQSLENRFIKEGGYTENLFKKRLNYRSKKVVNFSNLPN